MKKNNKENVDTEIIKDWIKEINESTNWLENLKTAISTEEFKKLHGNVERINRLQNKLNQIQIYLRNH